MLQTKIFRKLINTQNYRIEISRFLSNEQSILKKDVADRKHFRPPKELKLKPYTSSILSGIFTGKFDTKIFEFPAVLKDKDIDYLLEHGAACEKFFNENNRSPVTKDLIAKLQKLELFGLSVPHKYGGAGYGESETKFLVECCCVNPTVSQFLRYHEDFGCKIISTYGNEKQKQTYLPKLAKGEIFMTFAYLEDKPVVDLLNFEGTAFKNEVKNQYVIKATKKWVHNADTADVFLVLVKTSSSDDINLNIKSQIFLVDKNTPGVTVHRLTSKVGENANIYEVSFDNVEVPLDNLLGDSEMNGFDVLKSSLTHSSLSDAVSCLSLIKQMIHSSIHFVNEKNNGKQNVRTHGLLIKNLSLLSAYAYGLESTIYNTTGIYDSHDKPNILHESLLTKILSIESLKIAIDYYMQILGRDSFKISSVLDEAINALHYYSVFEENVEFLKMMIASEGLVLSAPKFSSEVKKIRMPYDNVKEFLSFAFSNEKKFISKHKKGFNFKMELHQSLSSVADSLEDACIKMQMSVRNLFIDYGELALNNEYIIISLAEMAAYVYGALSSLSRASSAVCYDFEKWENDVMVASVFALLATMKVEQLKSSKLTFFTFIDGYKKMGNLTFRLKEYPVEHPLSRTY